MSVGAVTVAARKGIPVRAFESNQIRSAATGTLHVPLTGVFVSLSARQTPNVPASYFLVRCTPVSEAQLISCRPSQGVSDCS